mgnify:FL=1
MSKGYTVQQDFEGTTEELFASCADMLVATIKELYPNKSVYQTKLLNFKAETAKGQFSVTKYDKDEGISYEITRDGKADITNLYWVQLPDNKSTLFYHEYGSANGFFGEMKMNLKLLLDRKSFDIKAKAVIGATMYHHKNRMEKKSSI